MESWPPRKRIKVDEQPETQRQSLRIHGEGTGCSNMTRRKLSIRNFSIPLQPVTFISHPRRIGMSTGHHDHRGFISETSDGNVPQAIVTIHNLSQPLQPVVFTSPHMGLREADQDQKSNRELITTSPALSSSRVSESSIAQGCGATDEASRMTHQGHLSSVIVQTAGGDLSTDLQAQNIGKNTSEYQTIRKCIPQLMTAIKHNLTELSGHLLSRGLITEDQSCELRNPMHSESSRASRLVDFVLSKVELNSACYHTFIECLDQDEENNRHILEILNGGQTSTVGSSNISKLNEYLLSNIYNPEASVTLSDKFPYLPNKKFISLALIEKEGIDRATVDAFTKGTLHGHADEIVRKKTPIDLEAVLKRPDGKQHLKHNVIFVEGAPGIGKSTFALELCRRQKEIESMKKFSLIILLRLREKEIQSIQSVDDVFESICRHDKSLQQSVSKEVTASGGKSVLFILDGFDELPTQFRKDSFFAKLIRGRIYLPACTVLVTSRPSASADLLPCITEYKHIEVLGFTKRDIEQYAESMLSDRPEILKDFLKYISDNPPIRGMMYIPLNSAIVLQIYKVNWKAPGKHIPQTMTELYTDLCLILLRRNFEEKNHPLANQINSNTALENLPECIKARVKLLGELAFEGALNQEITFSELPNGCDDLGFMNVSTGLYLGTRKSYSFLHLTLQEFLAAWYFSLLPPSEQKLKFICINKLTEEKSIWKPNSPMSRLNMMWIFVAGLTRFKYIGWKLVHRAIFSNLFIIHYFYEVQNTEEIKAACDHLPDTVRHVYVKTLLDCYIAGYCIAVSGHSWDITFIIKGDEVVEMLGKGLKSAPEISGSIYKIVLSSSSCTRKTIHHLCDSVPPQTLSQINDIDLFDNNLDKSAFDQLSNLMPHLTNLDTISLAANPGGDGAMVKLSQKLTQLVSLDISKVTLGLSDIKALSQLLKSTQYLEEFKIGDPYMSEECVSLMVEVVFSPSSIEMIFLKSIKWTSNNIDNFTLLENNKNIMVLIFELYHHDFEYNPLSLNPVIPAVAKALHKNSTLYHLGVPSCEWNDPEERSNCFDLKHENVVALSEMLKVNKTLKHLDIFIYLTYCDIQVLLGALQENHTLEQLHLCNSCIRISKGYVAPDE